MSGKDAEGVLNYAGHEDSGTSAASTRMVPCGVPGSLQLPNLVKPLLVDDYKGLY